MSLGCCAREVLLTAESGASDAVLGGSGLCGYHQTGNCEGHPHACTDKRPEPGIVTPRFACLWGSRVNSPNYHVPVVPELESKFSPHKINKAALTLCVLSSLGLTVHSAFTNNLHVQPSVRGFAPDSEGTGVGSNLCGSA